MFLHRTYSCASKVPFTSIVLIFKCSASAKWCVIAKSESRCLCSFASRMRERKCVMNSVWRTSSQRSRRRKSIQIKAFRQKQQTIYHLIWISAFEKKGNSEEMQLRPWTLQRRSGNDLDCECNCYFSTVDRHQNSWIRKHS